MTDPLKDYHPIQGLVNHLIEKGNKERAATQLTLGKLIKLLETIEPARPIKGFGEEMSYRGYYSDLAFEPSGEIKTAEVLLAQCKAALGQVYEGYKGGDNAMHVNTPLWISNYGTTGMKIMDLDVSAAVVVAITEEDD